MNSAIVVHHKFDAGWPYAADHFHHLWKREGPVQFVRIGPEDQRVMGEVIRDPKKVTRLVVLGAPVTDECLQRLSSLEEAVFDHSHLTDDQRRRLEDAGVRLYRHTSEGFWGQSVAEMALGLTIAALRQIPQLHRQIITDLTPWDYTPISGVGTSGSRGIQFGDNPAFVNGTVEGKRVRIVGAGNIGSRYASFMRALGADVEMWDPFASEPAFHRSGARKQWYLDRLVQDADIFAPMLPLTPKTQKLITADLIDALPKGCLVILVTRADICNMQAVRRRVLADEIALAADVFDVEPLPLDDPLLGRSNVIHTPHIAGRTKEANFRWAEMLAEQFRHI